MRQLPCEVITGGAAPLPPSLASTLTVIEFPVRIGGEEIRTSSDDVAQERIRARYDASRLNLIRLLPLLTELRLLDNSLEADPELGKTPTPIEILHIAAGHIVRMADPETVPQWAKPIVAAALTR
jgi:hypothetical protein